METTVDHFLKVNSLLLCKYQYQARFYPSAKYGAIYILCIPVVHVATAGLLAAPLRPQAPSRSRHNEIPLSQLDPSIHSNVVFFVHAAMLRVRPIFRMAYFHGRIHLVPVICESHNMIKSSSIRPCSKQIFPLVNR